MVEPVPGELQVSRIGRPIMQMAETCRKWDQSLQGLEENPNLSALVPGEPQGRSAARRKKKNASSGN
jgi:hypothetical protein